MKLLGHSQTSMAAAIEVWEWISNFTPHFIWACDCLSMPGLKLIHVSKRGPQGIAVSLDQHHEDIMTWRCSPHHWAFLSQIHRSPMDSPHKGASNVELPNDFFSQIFFLGPSTSILHRQAEHFVITITKTLHINIITLALSSYSN